jgi:hypothetical protein
VRRLLPIAISCLALVACGDDASPVQAADRAEASSRSAPTTTVPVTTSTTTMAPTTTAIPTTTMPTFTSSIGAVDAARVPYTWRPGCPVPLRDLRLLELTYWGYDDQAHRGELIVSARHAEAIVSVFAQLFDARFPIERMELVDAYEADDDRSMVANNTSAFNCREVAGQPGVLSQHSYGTAIDINPLVNPWVHAGRVDPPEGAQYADRSKQWKGAIYADDLVVRAFASIGWRWGGYWPGSYDYQHFAAG